MKAFIYLLIFIISFSALAWYAHHGFQDWSNQRHSIEQEFIYDLKRGTKLSELSASLKAGNVISSDWLFQTWVKFFADYGKFQAGKYKFIGALSPREVIADFTTGKTYNPVVFELTIPEGYTFKQVAQKLSSIANYQEIIALKDDKGFLESLKIPRLEGYIYPATYSFTEMPDAKKVISVAVSEFWKRLPNDYEERVKALGLSLDQAVIFASLIELETPNLEEKPLVSEVIWRRLKDNTTLGIDATIIYGIEDYQGNLTRKHLDDATNPYNTRIHIGLPPTAIGSPDTSSLLAVLNPSNEGYYYYVLDPQLGNLHHFSKTIAEHNNYVRALIMHSKRKSNE